MVGLDKTEFQQIDRAVREKFIQFQLEQNLDIDLGQAQIEEKKDTT